MVFGIQLRIYFGLYSAGERLSQEQAVRRAKVNALPAHAFGRLQSASDERLSAMMLSILDNIFESEL